MSLDHLGSTEYDGGPFGPEVPSEILFTAKLFSAADAKAIIPEPQLTALLQLCFKHISSKKFNRLQYLNLKQVVLKQWKDSQLMVQLNLSRNDFDRLFAGLLKITETIGRNFSAYQSRSAVNQLKTEILRYGHLSSELTELIFVQFFNRNTGAPSFLISNNWSSTGNRMVSLRWRIDVIISDRYLSKIIEPVVRFEMIISNGGVGNRKKVNFEARLAQFHRLRFLTACLLREIGQLETKINGPVK